MQSIFRQVRTTIRLYVIADGLARTFSVLAIGFWAFLLLDYVPVRFGFGEMPRTARIIAVGLELLVMSFLFWRYALGRAVRPVSDDNIRLLIERNHPEFRDRLLTSGLDSGGLILSDRSNRWLQELRQELDESIGRIRPRDLFDWRPLRRSVLFLAVPLLAYLGLWILAPAVASTGIQRALLVSDQPFQRQTLIRTVEFRRVQPDPRIEAWFPSRFREVVDRRILIGKGSRLELRICLPATDGARQLVIPSGCSLNYRFHDGRSGTLSMNPLQKEPNGDVWFICNSDVMNTLESGGEIWIRANDNSWGPIGLEIQDPPLLESLTESARFPEYLSQSNPLFEDRTGNFVNQSRYPADTRLEIVADFDRNVERAVAWQQTDSGPVEYPVHATGDKATIRLELEKETEIWFAAQERNGLVTPHPVRLVARVTEDRPPVVNVLPLGIGFAVTPNALLRFQVEGSDEFGIKEGMIELQVSGSENVFRREFEFSDGNSAVVELDLLELRRQNRIQIPPESLNQGNSVRIHTLVSDYHPDHEPTLGQVYEFELVDDRRLVQQVEREEAALRKRVEESFVEFEKSERLHAAVLRELQDQQTDVQSEKTLASPVRVYLQQVRLQAQKTARDLDSVANSIRRLTEQLENNRLKNDEKQQSLRDRIELPLRQFVDTGMARFQTSLVGLLENHKKWESNPDKNRISNLIDHAKKLQVRHNELLTSLDRIIQRMVKFESHNELLDSVRNLIDDHRKLMEATRKELDRKLFEGILD